MVELCIIGDHGCICRDERRANAIYGKTFKECVNYIATNPRDYAEMRRWTEDIVENLRKCEGEK